MRNLFIVLTPLALMLTLLMEDANAQVGIGTASPHASAKLDVSSTTQGILIPRMTLVDRLTIGSPAKGLMVYQTDGLVGPYHYNGSAWNSMGTSFYASDGTLTGDRTVVAGGYTLSFEPKTTFNPSVTASSTTAIGTQFSPTLIAASNSDVLYAVDINPSYTKGAFTGVVTYGLQVEGIDIGRGSGSFSTNTVIGNLGLSKNTSGASNTAVGNLALRNNTSGGSNTGVGTSALQANTTASNNTAVGKDALLAVTTGGNNTGLGTSAGNTLTTGTNNTFLGTSTAVAAGSETITNSTAVGFGASLSASNTIQLGNSSVTDVYSSGVLNVPSIKVTSTSTNTRFGYTALNAVTSGTNNTMVGHQAGLSIVSGGSNTGIGMNALQAITNSFYNTAVGKDALVAVTTGVSNTGLGWSAGSTLTTGTNNTFLGTSTAVAAGSETITNSTAIGYGASLSASNTIQLGNSSVTDVYSSGVLNVPSIKVTSTSTNTRFGYTALNAVTSGGMFNTMVGHQAGLNILNGGSNTGVGNNALQAATSCAYNTAVGKDALVAVTTGSANTGLGFMAGNTVTTGYNNTFLGSQTAVASGSETIYNSTAVGCGATLSASNTIQLGNASIATLRSQVSLTVASDRRLKDSITDLKYGLKEVMKLRPVEYVMNSNRLRQVGFIAQEVQSLVPEVVTGMEGDLSKGEILGLTYDKLVSVLTKAIQEQQVMIEEQRRLIGQLKAEFEAIKSRK